MLERAVKCISQRGCCPHLHAKGLHQSYRSLHSAFWRHGAGDLDHLPTSCFPHHSYLFEPLHEVHFDSAISASSPSPVLDSLHLQKSRSIYPRLSLYGLCQWHRFCQHCDSTRLLRAFVSSARQRSTNATINERGNSEILAKLQHHILKYKDGCYNESWSAAWELYISLDASQKTPSLAHGLVELLASSPRSSDKQRAILVFDQIPVNERQPELYATAIATLLNLKLLFKTIMVSEQALQSHINPGVAGVDALLAHFISNRQWQLLFRMWSRCISTFGESNFLAQWKSAFFKKVHSESGYNARVASLLYAIDEFPNSISPEADKDLVMSMVDSVFRHGGHFGPRQNRRIMSIMKQLCPTKPYLFDLATLRTLADRGVSLHLRVRHAFEIYKDGVGSSTLRPPRQRVVHSLLNAASRVENRDVIQRLFDDWHRFLGPPGSVVAGLFMKSFASFGDVEKVDQIFSAFVALHGKAPLQLYYHVLHVRALQPWPDAVREQMTLMQSDAGHSPDITCWNILLHSYQRNDDLESAMRCMSEIIEANISPDEYTIGTLMAAAAERGDVNLVERLYSSVEALKIHRTPIMNDCMVLALLNNHRWENAEMFASSATQASSPRDCTRMWSQILSYHALQPPPENLRRVLRVVRAVREKEVPFNSWTFSAMMRAYTVKRQTDLARRILHKVLLRKSMPIKAFHYAIIMDGYANEMAIEKGMRMYAEMLGRGIIPDISTKLALMKLHATAARSKIVADRENRPGIRADIPEELFEEIVSHSESGSLVGKEPWMSESRFSFLEAHPGVYFDFLLSLYSRSGAFHLVQSLLSRYENVNKVNSDQRREYPFRFVASIMNIKYRQSAHDEVRHYWILAKEFALKISKTGDQINQYQAAAWFAPVRRTILARHLDIYLRSLDAQRNHDKMREEINDFLSLGFDLDNRNWNLYVQLLAAREHYIEAFSLCETHLMASFTGWGNVNERVSYGQATQKRSRGIQYRGFGRKFYFLRHGQLEVEYATMVRLSLMHMNLRQDAPFDRAKDEALIEIESKAPMTLRAMRNMPRVTNFFASQILGTERIRHRRRPWLNANKRSV